jgi:S-adenosyl methyltransferase
LTGIRPPGVVGDLTTSRNGKGLPRDRQLSHPGQGTQPPQIDASVPHSARIWNSWLGGSTHEVAQRVAPASRIVYVDNDPVVLAHARALLTGSPGDAISYIDADLREPDGILEAAAKTLDFGQPVALMLMGILGHITDDQEARSILRRLRDALPSGSYLALYDGTDTNKAGVEAQEQYNRSGAVPYHLRSPEQLAGFFEGLELVEPGVVSCPQWRPDPAGGGRVRRCGPQALRAVGCLNWR